jgi:hypothetical protein
MPKEKNKMPTYYFDTETTSLQVDGKIITVQFQKLDNFGNPVGELVILKEWELGEEEMMKRLYNIICTENCWNFIPICQNHLFDFRFIFTKFKKYNLDIGKSEIDFLYSIPLIDLHPLFVIINSMSFKNSGLSDLTKKKARGDFIPKLYQEKNYLEIEEYIKQETASFITAFQILCKELPKLKPLLLEGKENGSQI